MKQWPADWAQRLRGKACPMCAEGRPETGHDGNARIFAGRVSDAYLVRGDVGQRGYTLVIWRGRHVADPTELSDDEAATYFGEVLRIGRAIEKHCRPIKMNFEMLGNSVPHLHTHVVPRYLDDGSPGMPSRFMRDASGPHGRIPDGEFAADIGALRALLR